jgi:hypothetical protein
LSQGLVPAYPLTYAFQVAVFIGMHHHA